MKPRLALPGIYPITDLKAADAPCHSQLVSRLAGAGAQMIQLREKHLSQRAFFRSAQRAMAAGAGYRVRILVNDDVSVAMGVDADGVHLGDEDLPPETARSLLGEEKIIGVSSHSVEQAARVAEGPCDYLAIGPIFESKGKPSGRRPLGPETIAGIRKLTDKPIVAIGGISIVNLVEVMEAGADCAAVITAVLAASDIAGAFKALADLAQKPR